MGRWSRLPDLKRGDRVYLEHCLGRKRRVCQDIRLKTLGAVGGRKASSSLTEAIREN